MTAFHPRSAINRRGIARIRWRRYRSNTSGIAASHGASSRSHGGWADVFSSVESRASDRIGALRVRLCLPLSEAGRSNPRRRCAVVPASQYPVWGCDGRHRARVVTPAPCLCVRAAGAPSRAQLYLSAVHSTSPMSFGLMPADTALVNHSICDSFSRSVRLFDSIAMTRASDQAITSGCPPSAPAVR